MTPVPDEETYVDGVLVEAVIVTLEVPVDTIVRIVTDSVELDPYVLPLDVSLELETQVLDEEAE